VEPRADEVTTGRLTDLVLVRVHGRADDYLAASPAERAAIVAACREDATVPDLAERIVSRTIYAQSASRLGPLRELLQNALDASPRGARVDVRSSADGAEVSVADRGHGMMRAELLGDLLVPFRTGKLGDPDAIGEHGIGFFSALELAPRLTVVTCARGEGWALAIEPIGAGPPYGDFAWRLAPLVPATPSPTGTSVLLRLARPVARAAFAAEIAEVARLVDPAVARIYVDDAPVNTARARMRRVASAPIEGPHGALGELAVYLSHGEIGRAEMSLTQAGLLVSPRIDPFPGAELALHRDVARALGQAGSILVVDLPVDVPLNKGRSAVAAHAAEAVDRAIAVAFERFVLGDALYDRDLLRAVDHRLASVLDRLLSGVLAGEPAGSLGATRPGHAPAARPLVAGPAATDDDEATTEPRGIALDTTAPAPTVAAPEEVVRFASALLAAPLFTLVTYASGREERTVATLGDVLDAYRAGRLRAYGDVPAVGPAYLVVSDPLPRALWHRLARTGEAVAPPPETAGSEPRVRVGSLAMARIGREALAEAAGHLPGVPMLCAAIGVLERIDAALAASAGLAPSPVSVHQDLYGPDEMAHTDGSGISVNFASARVRGLLAAALRGEPLAFGALVDLFVHEKTHVALATFIPRAQAEHGQTFYRKKDALRRALLTAIELGTVEDPAHAIAEARGAARTLELPSPELLARVFAAPAPA
jgi:hypothetical protein